MDTEHRSLAEVKEAAALCTENNGFLCIHKCPYGQDLNCWTSFNLDVLYYLEQVKEEA